MTTHEAAAREREYQQRQAATLERIAASVSQDPENAKQEAINNIRQAIRVIAPIWESMARFGHSQADDVAGAQADLEQAIRFLTGEEEPS